MKKLLYTTTAFVLCGGIVQANAACIATPTCSSLGYTSSSSCDGGLKCPFGEAWYCPSNSTQNCQNSGFIYDCSGTGYAGGSGTPCNNLYASCDCAEGYNWENGVCQQSRAIWGQCTGYAKNCSLGDILFSDGTCASDNISGKTPIAVVVYISSGGCGQALSLKSIGKYEWDIIYPPTDVAALQSYYSKEEASQDFDSCTNTKKIMAAGNASRYGAAWAANYYTTTGTEMGDWCLPAAGIFASYYNNQEAINTGFSLAGGTAFTNRTSIWSSSEQSSEYAWDAWGEITQNHKTGSSEVRPVLEF